MERVERVEVGDSSKRAEREREEQNMKHLRVVANCAQHAPTTTTLSLNQSLLALLSNK